MSQATRDRRCHNLWPSSNLAGKESLVVVPILGCVRDHHGRSCTPRKRRRVVGADLVVFEVEPLRRRWHRQVIVQFENAVTPLALLHT